MFYIRTADRLQRTAAWLERIDGGLDHLRDGHRRRLRSGICAELEAAMARHVARYADEWAATLEDPEQAAPLRVLRQRAGNPGPDHRLRDRTRPGQAGPDPLEVVRS